MRLVHILKSPYIFTFITPLLMAYLVLGTIAQKFIGVHEATSQYFYSPILWIYNIPLPGFLTLAVILLLNITCFSITQNWHKKTYGLMLMHIGVIGLILSMIFTPIWSKEGYISLSVGESASALTHYYHKTLNINFNESTYTLPHQSLQVGDTLSLPDIPFRIKVHEHCTNCTIEGRGETDKNFTGLGMHMRLSPQKLALKAEENLSGITLSLYHPQTQDETFLTLIDAVPTAQEVHGVRFTLSRTTEKLPFHIALTHFKKETYVGTDMAKNYASDVRITTTGTPTYDARIQMNSPLSIGHYTLYQSSMIAANGTAPSTSILSVVYNPVKDAPYAATLLIAIGLLAHALQKGRKQHK